MGTKHGKAGSILRKIYTSIENENKATEKRHRMQINFAKEADKAIAKAKKGKK